LVILIQQTLRNGFDLGIFGGFHGKVFLRVDFRFLLIEWALGTELQYKGSPRGAPTILKVSLWSVKRIGRSIAWKFEFSHGLSSSRLSRKKPVWPVSQTALTGLALWAVVKSFWARKSLSFYGCSCSKEERFLRQVSSGKGLWGVFGQNRPDRFPLPVWG
jgi:hypothetical protein